MRVLVIDDDLLLAKACARRLRSFGHEAVVAHDGASALTLAADFRPDAVVADLQLGEESGTEVVAALRARGLGRAFVVVTGSLEPVPLSEAGLADVPLVYKPWDFAELLALLERG